MSNTAIKPDGEMTIYQAAELRESLLVQLSTATEVVLDLSAITEMDSAGLQLVLATQAEARANQKPFRVSGASEVVRSLMAVYGLTDETLNLEAAS